MIFGEFSWIKICLERSSALVVSITKELALGPHRISWSLWWGPSWASPLTRGGGLTTMGLLSTCSRYTFSRAGVVPSTVLCKLTTGLPSGRDGWHNKDQSLHTSNGGCTQIIMMMTAYWGEASHGGYEDPQRLHQWTVFWTSYIICPNYLDFLLVCDFCQCHNDRRLLFSLIGPGLAFTCFLYGPQLRL